MLFEHLALNVSDPRALAQWYVEQLGLRIVLAGQDPPYGHFLTDDSGHMMLEVYHNPQLAYPDWGQRHHLDFHLALTSKDAQADVDRLCAAGATFVEWAACEDGSRIAMLRDPWGIALQICQRAHTLLKPTPSPS